MMTPTIRDKRSRGFTLMEVMFALGIFSVMILMFSSVFPSVLRGSHSGASYAQASLLAQHKIDQCREQGYGRFTTRQARWSVHSPHSGITDTTPAPVSNPSGFPTNSVSYSFTNVDGLGTGALPPGATGIVTIGPPAGTSWTPTGSLVQVTVTITWLSSLSSPVSRLITARFRHILC